MKDFIKCFGYLILIVSPFSILAIGYYAIVTIPITFALGLIAIGIGEILGYLQKNKKDE